MAVANATAISSALFHALGGDTNELPLVNVIGSGVNTPLLIGSTVKKL